MFYRSHFSTLPLTALEVIKLWASRKDRGREGGRKERTREREGGRSWEEEKGEDRWRLERDRERLTIAGRQVARSLLAADKVNFL